MRVRRTPWWHFLILVLIGCVCGAGVILVGDHTSFSLIGTTWFVTCILLILGGLILYSTWQVHLYITTPPMKRKRQIAPIQAVRILVMTKSLGLVCALLLGYYTVQSLLLLDRSDIPFYRGVIIRCAVTAVVCLIDLVCSIIGEWLCQIPPDDQQEGQQLTNRSSRNVVAAQISQRQQHN